jgi:spermidine/putrescine transport system permease protein
VSRERNRWLTAYALLIYAFLFAPIVILILFSFNDSRRNFIWRGFTTRWYPTLFANSDIVEALFVTLRVAAIAVVVSTVLGTLLGIGLARLRSRAAGPAETLLLLPMVTPEIVMGISLLLFFWQLLGAQGSFEQIVIAHITFCISYVAVTVRARAASLDDRLEEAARDLGASAWGAFRYVTLPLVAPGIAAGAMLAFALSFDDLIITTFNAGVGSSTLPLYIYSRIRFGVTPEINAVSTIIVVVTGVAILVALRMGTFRHEEVSARSAESS